MSDDAIVVLITYWNPTEAHAAKGVLEAAGIKAVVSGDYLATMNWAHINATGGVKLHVFGRDVEAAERVLGLNDDAEAEIENQDYGEQENTTSGGANAIDRPVGLAMAEDHELGAVSDADEFAKRAFFAAVFGIGFLPMLLVAAYHLIYVVRFTSDPLSRKGWWQFLTASFIVLTFVSLVLTMVLVLFTVGLP